MPLRINKHKFNKNWHLGIISYYKKEYSVKSPNYFLEMGEFRSK